MDGPLLIAELGSGGMATVFLAMRRGMGGFAKLVVVKRLRPDALDGDALAMFQDEARLSARMNHPNVVQTHEVGFDGEHFRLEMEYLDGQPLHRIVSRAKKAGREIPITIAVALVREVLAGLHYAHELVDYDGTVLGIVHRDVSPQNIFVTYDGLVKLVDFGIAKAAGQVAVTQFGMVKGKVRYMAPEQALGRPVDRRVDIFATGVVLWQLLTGRSYWGDVDQMAVVHRLSAGDLPPSPRHVRGDISEELDRICARALAHDAADRYATADEFLRALDEVPCGTDARPLGKLAAELFADTRRAVRGAIENAAAKGAAKGATQGAAQGSSQEEPATQLVSLASSSASQPGIVLPDPAPSSASVPAGPAKPRAWALLGTAFAIFLGVAGVLGIVNARREPPIAAGASGEPSPSPSPPPPRETHADEVPGSAAPPAPAPALPKEAASGVRGPPRGLPARRPASGGNKGTRTPGAATTADVLAASVVDAGAAPAAEPPRAERGRGTMRNLDVDDPWDAGQRP